MLKVGAGIWLFVPLGYGLTLFLLDVSWSRKAALMVAALIHLALFIPLQQLVTLYAVQHLTLLVVPLVFVFGSVIPQIALLIALYSWGASWPERRA
jgi:glycopeptide antibiotics resistance protein